MKLQLCYLVWVHQEYAEVIFLSFRAFGIDSDEETVGLPKGRKKESKDRRIFPRSWYLRL